MPVTDAMFGRPGRASCGERQREGEKKEEKNKSPKEDKTYSVKSQHRVIVLIESPRKKKRNAPPFPPPFPPSVPPTLDTRCHETNQTHVDLQS